MEYLEKIFKIRPAEKKKTICLAILFFAVGFYCMAITAVAFSVFNIRFGARFLPYVFLIFPFIYIVCSVIYIKVLPVSDKKVFFRYFILLVLLLHAFGLFILNQSFDKNIYYALLLIIVMFIEDNLLILSIITMQNVTDIESIKRLLPLTSGSATIGAVLAALILSNTAHVFDSLQLFFMLSGLIPIIAIAADILLSKHQVVSTENLENIERGFLGTLKYIKTNWFYILLILQVIVVLFISNINDFFYHVIVSDTLGTESGIMAFIGLTGTIQHLFFLLFSFFILLRLVMKVGSLNAVKIVLISATLGTILMMFSRDMIMLALISKVVFFVLVVGFNTSLEQILYKTVNPRFHDSFIASTDLFVSFSGYIIAGLVALLFSYGYLNIYMLSGISIAITLIMLTAWHLKQPSFVPALQNTLSLSEDIDVTKLFGQKGINRYLPQMTHKILNGTSPEKSFALDLIQRIDFENKETLLMEAFKTGDLVLKFKILDMIIANRISGNLIAGLIGSMELPLQEYLIKQLFMNCPCTMNNGLIGLIAREKRDIKRAGLSKQTGWMFEYLFEGKKANYRKIIADLISDKTDESQLNALKIMNNYFSMENDCNREYLPKLMQNLKTMRGLLINSVDLCSLFASEYNDSKYYLDNFFSSYCDYNLIKKVNACYTPPKVMEAFQESDLLIPQTYMLYSASQVKADSAKHNSTLFKEVRNKAYSLITEKKKIQKSSHPARNLLLEELDRLIIPVLAVLTDYIFSCYGIPAIKDLGQHLANNDRRDMVCELVKNALPLKISDDILPLLNEDITITDETYHYDALNTGNDGLNLMNLYRYLGVEPLDRELAEEINGLMILKSVPLFENLDMDMLCQMLAIADFKNMGAGLEVLKKGEDAEQFYIILEGKVGVYLKVDEDAISTIGRGEIFGELAVIDGGKRTATVKTLEESIFIEFRSKDFITLLKNNGAITFSVIRTLSRRLRTMLENAE